MYQPHSSGSPCPLCPSEKGKQVSRLNPRHPEEGCDQQGEARDGIIAEQANNESLCPLSLGGLVTLLGMVCHLLWAALEVGVLSILGSSLLGSCNMFACETV